MARELAYRLYVLSERKKRTEALWYNGLFQSWSEGVNLVKAVGSGLSEQQQLFGAALEDFKAKRATV